jgi:hypothetical protein
MSQSDRPFRHLCPEADQRDVLSDNEFWGRVFNQEGMPEPDETGDPPEGMPVEQCQVCGATETSCGYDDTGRPYIHCSDSFDV